MPNASHTVQDPPVRGDSDVGRTEGCVVGDELAPPHVVYALPLEAISARRCQAWSSMRVILSARQDLDQMNPRIGLLLGPSTSEI